MKLDSLHALYIEQLQDIYSAETQLLEALPKMAEAATNRDLKKGFETHLTQTKEQIQRLETILDREGKKSGGKKCKGMEGLIKEADELLKNKQVEPEVLDAGLIAAAQRVEHYEIAGYGTVCTYAEEMGHNEDLQLLRESLSEEKQTDQQLSVLAEKSINVKANT